MKTKAIVTMPPYAQFMENVVRHPIVSGIRLNTVMPVKESLDEVLERMSEVTKKYGKDLWIDLKCRQLRVKNFAVPPFTEIELSHKIKVYTPCKAYFSDRNEGATVLAVEENKLIMQEGPKRIIGPGESVTIPHPTLKIEGYLTDSDKRYIEAANKIELKNYMLSFVEKTEDIYELKKYSPNAKIVAKIESQRGLEYIKHEWKGEARLMAARGDLYMELHWPHTILESVENIFSKDENAIVASRILDSLAEQVEPSCADLGDLDNLLRIGYKEFMFGDEVCLREGSIITALNILYSVNKDRHNKYMKNISNCHNI